MLAKAVNAKVGDRKAKATSAEVRIEAAGTTAVVKTVDGAGKAPGVAIAEPTNRSNLNPDPWTFLKSAAMVPSMAK